MPKAALWRFELSLKVLLLQDALAGLRDVNLDVQISWQACEPPHADLASAARRFVNPRSAAHAPRACGLASSLSCVCFHRCALNVYSHTCALM